MTKNKMNKRKGVKKVIFALKLTSTLKDIHTKYELVSLNKNITSLDSLIFLDESRKIHKCVLSIPDFTNKNACCFWDRHPIGDITPIGCPLKYMPSVISRVFFSEITKEKFVVKESTVKNQQISTEIEITKDSDEYYETDGLFCGPECVLAFILDNKKNPIYFDSENLLRRIYSTSSNSTSSNSNSSNSTSSNSTSSNSELHPAPHWRILSAYGGTLTIESFRENFNRVDYENRGFYKPFFKPLAIAYEEKIKF